MNQAGSIGGMLPMAEIPTYWESDLSKYHFVHRRCLMHWCEIEIRSPKPVAGRLQHEQ